MGVRNGRRKPKPIRSVRGTTDTILTHWDEEAKKVSRVLFCDNGFADDKLGKRIPL